MRKLTFLWILVLSVVSMGTFAQTTNNTDKGKIDLTQGSRAFLTIGGDAIAGTLKTEIHDNTNLQIYRYVNSVWQKQVYGTASKASLLRINGTNYTCAGAYFTGSSILTLVSQTAITANHIQSIWENAGVVRLTQDASYVTGTAYVRYKWTITNLSGSTLSDIRFFHGQDNTLNGNDYGMSAWDPTTNSIIAYSTSGTDQFRLYFQGITVPYAYQGGSYSAMRTSVAAGALNNTADPANVDQGYALEWRTASIAASGNYVIDAVEKFSSAAVTNLEVTAPLSASVSAGSPTVVNFQVRNLTATATTVTVSSLVNLTNWTATIQGNTTISLAANATQAVAVLVTAPGNASGTTAVVTLTAIDGSGTASDFCNVSATDPAAEGCHNMEGFSETFTFIPGCHNMEGFSAMFTLVAAPTILTYSPDAIIATKGVTNVSSTPTNGGGVITNYTITPELPAGVTIAPVTGIISGIPTALSTIATYTITGANFAGSTTSSFTLTVNDVAPSELVYSYNPINAAINVSNITSTPTAEGGPVVSYTIEPTLPTGLTFDAVTGIISGISSEVVTNKNYTVTATNTGGSTTCEVLITVYEGISAPNTITPNNDGINDTWIIPNVADFAGYELTIFNNLGATLYTTSNYNNDWDVTYKGNELPAGTYYYVFIKGSTVHKGFITVLRAK